MKILKIIHGYPPFYNAGSEVYSQTLCRTLKALGHQVEVFCREENPFAADYVMRTRYDNKIPIHMVNIPLEKHRYRYHHKIVDDQCENLLLKFKPDVVHIGHLNHLSITLIERIKKHDLPIVYTLHDFWLMCPRGQFVQRNPKDTNNPWALCRGQQDQKCAKRCYAGYHSGLEEDTQLDIDYWTNWIKRRMNAVRQQVIMVDHFIAPSKQLQKRFVDEFKLPQKKVSYLDYGFELGSLSNRRRCKEASFVFGYIGTHIPTKGIDHLIQAFGQLNKPNVRLRIWGRSIGQNTTTLKRLVSTLPSNIQSKIEWMQEYQNEKIVEAVFNHVDCIVVPSIWQENSPLVIHEALQARVGVITADLGGMSEYIHHEKNGWLYKHRDRTSLAATMKAVINDAQSFDKISNRGYIRSQTGDVPSALAHTTQLTQLYQQLIGRTSHD